MRQDLKWISSRKPTAQTLKRVRSWAVPALWRIHKGIHNRYNQIPRTESKDEKQFAKEILIPYDDEDQDADSKEERPARTVEIYIDDKDNDIDDVFDTLEIDSDHEYTINMIIEEDETGHYRIDVDGETIKEDKVPYK
ncbi:hypothetical protein [Salinicoccus sp. CNSTN-B1]